MNLPATLFVDSGVWYALFNKRDAYHQRARIFFESLKEQPIRLITTDYIFDETLTLLRYHTTHQTARLFGQHFHSSSVVCESISPEIHKSAWQIFLDYEDQTFSFTDCTSFAFMRLKNIRDAFAFDAHFQTMGFAIHPL